MPRRESTDRTAASARSIRASVVIVTGTPYRTRLARQGIAGLSAVDRRHNTLIARTSALLKPSSRRGVTTPISSPARIPGRNGSAASSAFVPVATTSMPCDRASAAIVPSTVDLQK